MITLLAIFVLPLIIFIYSGLGKEGRANFALYVSCEYQVFMEDLNDVTNYRVYIRLYKARLYKAINNSTTNPQTATI